MAALLALLSSLLWGTADFGGGMASRRLPPVVVVAWSQAAGLVGTLALAVAVHAWQPPGRWVLWAVLAGVLGGLGLVTFYTALATGTMGVVSPIAALGVVVPVLAGVATGDRPTATQLAGMALAVFGAVAASGPELTGGARARSVLLAAAAGLFFGAALFGIAQGARTSAVLTMLVMRVTSVLGFAIAGLVLRRGSGLAVRDLRLVVPVGLADAGANVLFGLASQRGMVSVVAVIGTLYPVATVLLARYVLAERMQAVQRAGVAAALVGVAMIGAG